MSSKTMKMMNKPFSLLTSCRDIIMKSCFARINMINQYIIWLIHIIRIGNL